VIIRWELEGGSGGKMVSHYLTGQLQGFNAMGVRPRGDKIQRARAFSAQVEAGNVSIIPHLPGEDEYLTELHHFPAWRFDDRVDASSGAYNFLVTESEAWSEADLAALRNN
jgi:predicted phage terminase large subunit-like protein